MPGTPTGIQAWFNFNRTDLLGTPDPDGGFPKPDSNILAPAGTRASAPADGVVTGISNNFSSPFGNTVTVRFDKPPNPQATHYAFLHLHSVADGLKVGQRVQAGDTLGFVGSNPQNAPLGFAFYPGNDYGNDSSWKSFKTVANVTGPFNPVGYLNALKSGKVANVNPASGANANPDNKDGLGLTNPFDWNSISGTLVLWGEHIAIFVIALLFIIIGLVFLMGGSQVGQTVGKIAKIGAMA